MSQTQRQGFLTRLGAAARLMEGQAAESIEQRLTTIERELAAINRRLAEGDDAGWQVGRNVTDNAAPSADVTKDQS
jgi:hypothetical protein